MDEDVKPAALAAGAPGVKAKRRKAKHLGIKRKSRGFQKPAGVEFDWSSGRYRRVDLWQPLSSGDEHD